ncbi:MAG: periplasmic heavy metal sensor [Planctomycetes bacterium]|nr:periplasmic heavy metal sensor [Planctomycetota bacterium]
MKPATGTFSILLVFSASSLLAQAPRPDPLAENLFPPDLVLQFQSEIVLTDEQREAIRAEMEKAHPRFEALRQQLEKETEKLAELLKKERVDEKAALAQFDQVQNLERDLKRAHLALVIGLKNKLTPEQQARLQELRKKFAADKQPASIPSKLEKVKAGVEQWQSEGHDPSPVGIIMQEFEPLMKERKFREAEAVIDRALKVLEENPKDKDARPEKKSSASPPAEPHAQSTNAKNPEALRAEIESLIATTNVPWRQIPWKSCLLEGLKESREQRKPLMFWVFIDRPADDRRC